VRKKKIRKERQAYAGAGEETAEEARTVVVDRGRWAGFE
jgi:hypothetical protein